MKRLGIRRMFNSAFDNSLASAFRIGLDFSLAQPFSSLNFLSKEVDGEK